MDKETLTNQYGRAGVDFLAVKLAAMFSTIKTDEDRARHNAILTDVMIMLGDGKSQMTVFKQVAGAIIREAEMDRRRKKARFRLGRMVADRILSIGKG